MTQEDRNLLLTIIKSPMACFDYTTLSCKHCPVQCDNGDFWKPPLKTSVVRQNALRLLTENFPEDAVELKL